MADDRSVARSLNSFTGFLSNHDQNNVAQFVADYFCVDDNVDSSLDDDSKQL